jgi:proteasome lid subunit RPN8/RPN11
MGEPVSVAAVLAAIRTENAARIACPHCGGEIVASVAGMRWRAHGPGRIAERLSVQLGGLEREELHVLLLDAKCGVMSQRRVYMGNVSASLVRIGELFQAAVEQHASGIALVHNHPSGDATPSPDDLHLTAEAIAAGRLLDIAVLDHVIVAGGGFVSLRQEGMVFDQLGGRSAASEGSRMSTIRLVDGQFIDEAGETYDLRDAIEEIPWVTAKMYAATAPHQYVVLGRCPTLAWDVLATAISRHPDSYLGFWRGYRRPIRYFEFEGRRYWRTASGGRGGVTHMLNRGMLEDAEPPRRVDAGAKAAPTWDGPPWEPDGTPWPAWYVEGPDGQYRYERRLDPFRTRRGR